MTQRDSALRAALAFLIFAPAISMAQFTTAVINGTVRDPTSAEIAGATVELENRDTGLKRTTVTSASGTYTFTQIHLEFTRSRSQSKVLRPYANRASN